MSVSSNLAKAEQQRLFHLRGVVQFRPVTLCDYGKGDSRGARGGWVSGTGPIIGVWASSL